MLTAAWNPLTPHPQQVAMWRSKARFIAADCGRGSGKTVISQRRIVRYLQIASPFPNPRFFYLLPTYNQARRVAWKNIKTLIPKHWIVRISESDLEIDTIYGSTLFVFGMDKPSRFEGLQYNGGVMDECCDYSRAGTFKLSVMPALGERHGWCWRIGVPKRFGPSAREFNECCKEWATKGDQWARFSWPSSDIMTADEITLAQSMMDLKDYNEQYNASWETASGLVYYAYDHETIQPWKYDPALPLIVGSDFNVSPMAWVILQMDTAGVLHVFDEIWLRDTNTQKTMNELHRRYGTHKSGWWFFGDASGQARKSAAATTDYLIIRNDMRFGDSKIFYPNANPPVFDRIASVNWALNSANGKRNLFIDKKCLHLIKDLEYLAFREGSREIDERDPDAKHITDALGYVIHFLKPMRIEGKGLAPRVLISQGA